MPRPGAMAVALIFTQDQQVVFANHIKLCAIWQAICGFAGFSVHTKKSMIATVQRKIMSVPSYKLISVIIVQPGLAIVW